MFTLSDSEATRCPPSEFSICALTPFLFIVSITVQLNRSLEWAFSINFFAFFSLPHRLLTKLLSLGKISPQIKRKTLNGPWPDFTVLL